MREIDELMKMELRLKSLKKELKETHGSTRSSVHLQIAIKAAMDSIYRCYTIMMNTEHKDESLRNNRKVQTSFRGS